VTWTSGSVPTSSPQYVSSSSTSLASSSSSAQVSFDAEDEGICGSTACIISSSDLHSSENVTVTGKRVITRKADKQKSLE
jgi:hypothetical protein